MVILISNADNTHLQKELARLLYMAIHANVAPPHSRASWISRVEGLIYVQFDMQW